MGRIVFGLAGAGLFAGIALAQTTNYAPNSSSDPTRLPKTEAAPATGPKAGGVGVNSSAGSGNQSVATTTDNAAQPAKGANSFTMGEAKSRIEKNGFSDVTGLKKDDDGVWRGSAKKNGTTTNVWLDYKGNTGTGG